jgi:perosamine synthetase
MKKSKKMILQHKPIFDQLDIDSVSNTIKNNWISEGPETKKFQENYRKFVGTKYAIATTSGTAAIFLALMGAGIKPGDEVIIPNMTFIATASAVKLAGAKPILAEVKEDNFTISIDSIKNKVSKKTKGIIPVHLNGRSTDFDELMELAKKLNLKIIEDASQGLGSKYNKKNQGSMGDVAAFSLAPTKIITTGQGGMITTNNFKIFDTIRKIKDQGRKDKSENYKMVGYNFKFTDLQAALGNSQFSKLKNKIKKLDKLYKLYTELLNKNKYIIIPPKRKENQLWYFDILVKNRIKLQKKLEKNQIITRSFHQPLNSRLPYKSKENFSISKKISSTGLYLPSHANLTQSEIEYVSDKINSFFK